MTADSCQNQALAVFAGGSCLVNPPARSSALQILGNGVIESPETCV